MTTRHLAEWVAGLRHDDLPEPVRARLQDLLADYVGIATRARFDADSTPSLLAAVDSLGLARGPCSILGGGPKCAAPAAAMINGALAHSLDFDDTHAPAIVHVTAPVISAALAAAELCPADDAALACAIVAGIETMVRVSLAADAVDHLERGFHPTATCGTFGAVAAAGRMLGLDATEQAHAFGTALSQAGGTFQFLANGAWTKRFQVGNAAASGVTAAMLAAHGYTGASEALEGRHGFLRLYSRTPRPDALVEGLGSRWETLAVALKPYPCCRAIHSALDGVLALRAEHGLAIADVGRIEVGLADRLIDVVAEPLDRKRTPRTVVDAQFSVHFCAAAALANGRFAWDDYGASLADPAIRALAARGAAFRDAQAQSHYPAWQSARVRLHLTGGGQVERFVPIPPGEPERPMDDAAIREKFRSLVTGADARLDADRLWRTVRSFGSGDSARRILAASDAGRASVPC